ncbi:MAG TPA: pilus assembly protein PilM [Terrimicrobiaceae bacterium]|nr:pilus assembly protein PilM [Terrimicrobiaceae bacterium]
MAAPTRILALNLGMQTVTLADFRVSAAGAVTLHGCKQEELIADPAADATRPAQIEAAVTGLRKALGIKANEKINFSLPSQSVFTRFVKLPGGTPDEVASIIGFEAQQNVPFPIDEVVWDYQIMGESKDNNWDVALVAIKADQLGETNTSVNKGGFRSSVIDVAPMALYNAFRYNYGDLTGCSLLIDIGARTTNLIFIEGQRVFSRSIPVGGNTISAAIAKEFKQDITVGEKLKVEKGFVGLGGAYAEPEDPTEAKISKIVRNTMTRLHAEIARSISFYRQNQSGSAPVRAYLCGGTVSLPYMIEFFSEKLQMPIEHFNSLRNVTVADQETASYVANKAHTLGESLGCALRALGNCPIEINLRPLSVVREQDLAKRKPFLVLAAICIILTPAAWWFFYNRATTITQEMLDSVNAEAAQLEGIANQFTALEAETKKLQELAAPLILAASERTAWAAILDELGAKLPARFIWVTNLVPLSEGRPYNFVSGAQNSSSAPSVTAQPANPSAPPKPGQAPSGPPKIDALQVSGLYLSNPPNTQEAKMIDDFVDRLQKSDLFKIEEKDKARVVVQRTTPDGQSWAYGFTIVLPLRNPITLP